MFVRSATVVGISTVIAKAAALSCSVLANNTNFIEIYKARGGCSISSSSSIRKMCGNGNKQTASTTTDFCFNDYDVVGFDLDCTLLRYNLNEMCPLIYEVLRNYLLQQGYPSILRDNSLNMDFIQKGLILDDENGNLLKLGVDAVILRATHGTKLLTDAEIEQLYGESRQWHMTSEFVRDPLSTWNGPATECMRTLLDYFDMPVSMLFAQAVDAVDKQKQQAKQKSYGIWKDLLAALVLNYSREQFSNGESAYFKALKADISRYVLQSSAQLIQWLQQLRQAGKCTFLLTGSNGDFANLTATAALGAQWQELFDCVVCYAKKPGFFTQQRAFLRVQQLQELPASEIGSSDALPLNTLYTQGNWTQLRAAFAQKLHKPNEQLRAVYVGDNLIQDIYTPAVCRGSNLDTLAVCEEMLCSDGISPLNNFVFDKVLSSQLWGSYFHVQGAPTLWANIIDSYSQLCVPHVEALAAHPIQHKHTKLKLCQWIRSG